MDHHKRFEYCHTRLKYRDGKNPTAIKVYSVVTESKNMYVFGVPKINLGKEIKAELQKFGEITRCTNVTDDMAKRGAGEFSFDLFFTLLANTSFGI